MPIRGQRSLSFHCTPTGAFMYAGLYKGPGTETRPKRTGIHVGTNLRKSAKISRFSGFSDGMHEACKERRK